MMQRPWVRITLAILVLLLFLGACVILPNVVDLGLGASGDGASSSTTLTIAAAANVMPAFEEIGRDFTEQTGIVVDFTFGSSQQLARQVEAGAPIDVFASADVQAIEELNDRGLLVPESIGIYARGSLVLWAHDLPERNINELAALTRPDVRRIAIANPDHAPYGVAARTALTTAGIWDDVEPKIVPAQNVRAALQMAESGNVDIALVATSLANATEPDQWIPLATELHDPIDQAIAVVGETSNNAAAREFVRYVLDGPGRQTLEQYGFEIPGGTGS